MDMRPTFYIGMEVKARELEGKMLVALEAAARGFRVVIGNRMHIHAGLRLGILPKSTMFTKDISKGSMHLLRLVASHGCRLVSQDEESGLLDQSYDSFLLQRSSPETLDMADAVFCWGSHDYEAWCRHYPISKPKFHQSGSPRVDFWREDFSPYYAESVSKIRARYGAFVLIASNFPIANNYMPMEQYILNGKLSGAIKNEDDANAMREKMNDIRKMFHHFTELVSQLASEFPEINFVVRPHPAEKISGWENALPKSQNVHVCFEGGISAWVRSCSAVLHNGCTTGIEAYVARVPAIAYVPFQSPSNREIPNQLSLTRTTVKEVSDTLGRILKGDITTENRRPENDSLIEARLANIHGDTAASRMVDVLETISIPDRPKLRGGALGTLIGAKENIRRYIRTKVGRETNDMRKFPKLRIEELSQIKKDLARITERYNSCAITKLYGDLFVIERTNLDP